MKETYELTLNEYREEILNHKREFMMFNRPATLWIEAAQRTGNNLDVVMKDFNWRTADEHEGIVLTAYADGTPVPLRVIREYAHCLRDDIRMQLQEV